MSSICYERFNELDNDQDWLSFGEKLSNLPGEVVAGKQKNPWRYLIYGAVSGAVSRTVTAPLERLKILNQA